MATMLDCCVISENPSHRRSAATPSFEFPLMPCPRTFRSSLDLQRPHFSNMKRVKLRVIFVKGEDVEVLKMKTALDIEKAFLWGGESRLR